MYLFSGLSLVFWTEHKILERNCKNYAIQLHLYVWIWSGFLKGDADKIWNNNFEMLKSWN